MSLLLLFRPSRTTVTPGAVLPGPTLNWREPAALYAIDPSTGMWREPSTLNASEPSADYWREPPIRSGQ